MKIAQVLNNLRLVFTQDFFFFLSLIIQADLSLWSYILKVRMSSNLKKKWLKYMNKMIKNLYY